MIQSGEITKTKQQFLFIVIGEYLISGFFWVFLTVGSLKSSNGKNDIELFFFSMFVLMISNGVWEIITGWYADKFKRQFSMSAGFAACLLGFCLMGIAALSFFESEAQTSGLFTIRDFIWVAGISIWSLGPALLSGAEEAWLVDRCNFFSNNPPENVEDIFKQSASYGIIAKSVGAAICLIIFCPFIHQQTNETVHQTPFLIAAIISGLLSAWLLYKSLRLKEEYWSNPKYQTNESLFSFLGKGLQDLWKTPYRWFTLGYVGAMNLNYIISTTVWAYILLKKDILPGSSPDSEERGLIIWAGIIIIIELLSGYQSIWFSKKIDFIKKGSVKIPIASLMYLVPVIPFFLLYQFDPQNAYLYMLLAAIFSFRTVHASIYGTLNTIGQLAIKSDERRAILISMSSAISAVFMACLFYLFYSISDNNDANGASQIELFWGVATPVCVILLALGGYLMAKTNKKIG